MIRRSTVLLIIDDNTTPNMRLIVKWGIGLRGIRSIIYRSWWLISNNMVVVLFGIVF